MASFQLPPPASGMRYPDAWTAQAAPRFVRPTALSTSRRLRHSVLTSCMMLLLLRSASPAPVTTVRRSPHRLAAR